MKKRIFLLLLLAAAAACSACRTESPSVSTQEAAYPRQAVELVAPAGAASGYDLTIRSVSQCLKETGLCPYPSPTSPGREAASPCAI